MGLDYLTEAETTQINEARRRRNKVIGWLLAGFALLFYLVTFVRIGGM